jgi:hypothetical protein
VGGRSGFKQVGSLGGDIHGGYCGPDLEVDLQFERNGSAYLDVLLEDIESGSNDAKVVRIVGDVIELKTSLIIRLHGPGVTGYRISNLNGGRLHDC